MEENASPPPDDDQEAQKRPQVRDLFVWKSLNRPAWQYSKEAFTTLGAVCLLLSIIFAFFQEWLAIFVTWAALFLFYALSKVAPVEVEHKITTQGIISMDKSYLWVELGPFWFSEKGTDTLLHIAHRNIFGQLVILIDRAEREKIRDILAEYLPYIEVMEKSTTEKMTDWFAKKFPLEKMINAKTTSSNPPIPS